MPPCHRDTDARICGALTTVKLQTNVFVNRLLWAVHYDVDTHCGEGRLVAATPAKNVYINNIWVICAPSADFAYPDCPYIGEHTIPKPVGGSPNTFVYSGGGGG